VGQGAADHKAGFVAARDTCKTIDPGLEMMLIAQNFKACNERKPNAI
jgi:hypothetical protein